MQLSAVICHCSWWPTVMLRAISLWLQQNLHIFQIIIKLLFPAANGAFGYIFGPFFSSLQGQEITCGGWNFNWYLYNLRNTGLNSPSTEASCILKLLSINLTDAASMCSVRSLRKHYCSFGICWFYSCAFLNEMLSRSNERNVWLMSWLETSPHMQLSSALLLYIDCLTL